MKCAAVKRRSSLPMATEKKLIVSPYRLSSVAVVQKSFEATAYQRGLRFTKVAPVTLSGEPDGSEETLPLLTERLAESARQCQGQGGISTGRAQQVADADTMHAAQQTGEEVSELIRRGFSLPDFRGAHHGTHTGLLAHRDHLVRAGAFEAGGEEEQRTAGTCQAYRMRDVMRRGKTGQSQKPAAILHYIVPSFSVQLPQKIRQVEPSCPCQLCQPLDRCREVPFTLCQPAQIIERHGQR